MKISDQGIKRLEFVDRPVLECVMIVAPITMLMVVSMAFHELAFLRTPLGLSAAGATMAVLLVLIYNTTRVVFDVEEDTAIIERSYLYGEEKEEFSLSEIRRFEVEEVSTRDTAQLAVTLTVRGRSPIKLGSIIGGSNDWKQREFEDAFERIVGEHIGGGPEFDRSESSGGFAPEAGSPQLAQGEEPETQDREDRQKPSDVAVTPRDSDTNAGW